MGPRLEVRSRLSRADEPLPELAKGLLLDLPHPLAGYAKCLSDLLERLWFVLPKAEALDDHPPLTLWEAINNQSNLMSLRTLIRGLTRVFTVGSDEIAAVGVSVLPDRLVKR